jgi:hypothetical protein
MFFRRLIIPIIFDGKQIPFLEGSSNIDIELLGDLYDEITLVINSKTNSNLRYFITRTIVDMIKGDLMISE